MASGSPLLQFIPSNQLSVPSVQLVVAASAADMESAKAVMASGTAFLVASFRALREEDVFFMHDRR